MSTDGSQVRAGAALVELRSLSLWAADRCPPACVAFRGRVWRRVGTRVRSGRGSGERRSGRKTPCHRSRACVVGASVAGGECRVCWELYGYRWAGDLYRLASVLRQLARAATCRTPRVLEACSRRGSAGRRRASGNDVTTRFGAANHSYLVDPASSDMLVSKIKPCMSKYKRTCTVKLRMAH